MIQIFTMSCNYYVCAFGYKLFPVAYLQIVKQKTKRWPIYKNLKVFLIFLLYIYIEIRVARSLQLFDYSLEYVRSLVSHTHTPDYYMEKFRKSSPKMLAINFKAIVKWIHPINFFLVTFGMGCLQDGGPTFSFFFNFLIFYNRKLEL